jgi:hypothetical protein
MIGAEAQGGRWPRLLQAAIDAFSLPDLRAKILFTLGMLALYRFVAHIPIPGINQAQLDTLFQNNELLGFLDLFSGGALSRMSIVALGVFPYITSSIVIQLPGRRIGPGEDQSYGPLAYGAHRPGPGVRPVGAAGAKQRFD